ncbi:hypothetical protein HJG60_011536 [Phyllostomus discolor]|uniref:Uncharacterized protein n=1 Tax=Phyllostomus discolor TaxID=89673 RepID=A0A833ZTW7_9CHIR|nr:hypothetical protein HJG60_011536 [Phyllostomus discolor]
MKAQTPPASLQRNLVIHTPPYLPAVNVLDAEKPSKAAMEVAEKTGKATELRKGVDTPRPVVFKDDLPVQDESRVNLANPAIKGENLQDNYSEIRLKRQQLAPKYGRPSQLLEKDTMILELKELLEAMRAAPLTKESQAKIMVANLRRQAAERRVQAWAVATQRQDSEPHIDQRPDNQRLHEDLRAAQSSFPNILPNLKPQQEEEQGYPESVLQGEPVLQPCPPKTPKPTSMGTKSKIIPQWFLNYQTPPNPELVDFPSGRQHRQTRLASLHNDIKITSEI